MTCLFLKWKYYIDYEHMTGNTEGFDSKGCGIKREDCISMYFWNKLLTYLLKPVPMAERSEAQSCSLADDFSSITVS